MDGLLKTVRVFRILRHHMMFSLDVAEAARYRLTMLADVTDVVPRADRSC